MQILNILDTSSFLPTLKTGSLSRDIRHHNSIWLRGDHTVMKLLSYTMMFIIGLSVSSFHPANNRLRAPHTTSVVVERDFHDTTNTNINAFTVQNPNDNEHWSVRFSVFLNVANPLQATMAANDLTQFYSAILTMARVVWARGTPQTWRRAMMGGLVLMFQSDSPIPWEFLSAFLTTMVSTI